MHRDAVKAQMATLREWADIWARYRSVGNEHGVDELIFCLEEASDRMGVIAGVEDALPEQSPSASDVGGGPQFFIRKAGGDIPDRSQDFREG